MEAINFETEVSATHSSVDKLRVIAFLLGIFGAGAAVAVLLFSSLFGGALHGPRPLHLDHATMPLAVGQFHGPHEGPQGPPPGERGPPPGGANVSTSSHFFDTANKLELGGASHSQAVKALDASADTTKVYPTTGKPVYEAAVAKEATIVVNPELAIPKGQSP